VIGLNSSITAPGLGKERGGRPVLALAGTGE